MGRNKNNIKIGLKDLQKIRNYKKELGNLQKKYDELYIERTNLLEAHEIIRLKEKRLDNLLHELRHINGGLKDSINLIDFDVYPNLRDIWAQANLLSIRMLMYDYEVNPSILTTTRKSAVPIYKRVDKVAKCFKHHPSYKRTPIVLTGETYLSFLATDILEIAFYIILHNATKYADPGTQIKIEFIEDMGANNKLTVKFTNFGSLPTDIELPKLFDREYRGVNAVDVKGTGIGLSSLKNICDSSDVIVDIKLCRDVNNENKGQFIISLVFENCRQQLQIGC